MPYKAQRAELLAVVREIAAGDLVIGTWGNASCRAGEHILITPSGMDYNAMEPEDLVLLDAAGQVVAGAWRPSVESPLHLAIYRARPEVQAIVHVHSENASAFAVAGHTIPVVLEETAQLIGHPIAVAAYARSGSQELAAAVLKVLGEAGTAVLLAHHGQLTVGGTPAEALQRARVVEKTAAVTFKALALGAVNPLPEAESALTVAHPFPYTLHPIP